MKNYKGTGVQIDNYKTYKTVLGCSDDSFLLSRYAMEFLDDQFMPDAVSIAKHIQQMKRLVLGWNA